MDPSWITVAVGAIKALSYVYDIITFPVYVMLQRPWEKRTRSRRVKAKPVYKDDKSVIYRNVDPIKTMHVTLEKEGIGTLEAMLKWVAVAHANKKCLGTRKIFAEQDEVQPNGRVFKKVSTFCILFFTSLSYSLILVFYDQKLENQKNLFTFS